jgi:putative ABC transport system permease protein
MNPAAFVGILFALAYGAAALLAVRKRLLGRLAWREAVRRRGQSLLVVAGLMIGAAAITAALVGADASADSIRLNAYRQWGNIDLTVTAGNRYFAPSAASHISRAVDADAGLHELVDGVTGGIEAVGAVADVDRKQGQPSVTIVGFDAAAQSAFGRYDLVDGRATDGSDMAPGDVLLSQGLAHELLARVGDTLNVTVDVRASAAGAAPAPKLLAARVAGIAKPVGPGAYTLRDAVFAPLDTAQRIAGVRAINVVRISATGGMRSGLGPSKRALPLLRPVVAHVDAGLGVHPVKAAEIATAEKGGEFLRALLVGMSALIVAAGSALVVNLVAMLAEERRSRLGVLRALGLNRRGVVTLSILEGALYSVVAAGVGTAVGVFAGRLVARRFQEAFTQLPGFNADLAFVFRLHPQTVAAAFGLGALLTLLVVYFASRRTARMTIPAAIRNLPEPPPGKRPRTWWRVALRIAVVLLGLAGVAGGQDIPRLIGGIALLLVLSSATRARMSSRRHATLTGLVLAVWAFALIGISDPNADPNEFFGLFVMSMLISVFGLSIIATANLKIAERFVGLLGHAVGALRPMLRPPLAYLARRPVRTGLSTGVFAVVLAMIQLFAVFLFIFRPNDARDSAGYDIRVISTATTRIDLPPSIQAEVQSSSLVPTRGFIGSFDSPNGFSGEHVFVPLYELEGEGLQDPPVHIAQRRRSLESDAAVWQALAREKNAVVSDFGNPGGRVTLGGPHGRVTFKIIASQAFGILDGVIATPETLAPFKGAPLGATMLVKVKEGRSPAKVAHDIERELFADGVDAVPIHKLLLDGYKANVTFFSVIDILMRMGLVVGILSLGIIALRAIVERRHVIGVMRALGYSRRSVMAGLMTEAAATATIGAVVGMAAGTVMGYMFYRQFNAQLSFGIAPSSILSALALVFVAVLLVTLGPAWRASRLPPAEAVRYSE